MEKPIGSKVVYIDEDKNKFLLKIEFSDGECGDARFKCFFDMKDCSSNRRREQVGSCSRGDEEDEECVYFRLLKAKKYKS